MKTTGRIEVRVDILNKKRLVVNITQLIKPSRFYHVAIATYLEYKKRSDKCKDKNFHFVSRFKPFHNYDLQYYCAKQSKSVHL